MSEVKIIGHNPPDTDSVTSAIVFAWYLRTYAGEDAKGYKAGKLNKETKLVLDYFHVTEPETATEFVPEDRVIIVDTNNPEELTVGITDADILQIVDHHKLSPLTTKKPIDVVIKPWASTSTVLWDVMQEAHSEMPKEMAGLMLAGIISDTLKFTSATTTEHDKAVAKRLAAIADVNIDQLAEAMFNAKSDISDLTPHDILLLDDKNYEFGTQKVKIAVHETTRPENVYAIRAELEKEMKAIKAKEGLAEVFFFVVDILKSEAFLYIQNDFVRGVAEKAFGQPIKNGLMRLPNVTSRKKQMVPKFEMALK